MVQRRTNKGVVIDMEVPLFKTQMSLQWAT